MTVEVTEVESSFVIIPDRFDLAVHRSASAKLSLSKFWITVQCQCILEETMPLVSEENNKLNVLLFRWCHHRTTF